jgi:hypothetical protein
VFIRFLGGMFGIVFGLRRLIPLRLFAFFGRLDSSRCGFARHRRGRWCDLRPWGPVVHDSGPELCAWGHHRWHPRPEGRVRERTRWKHLSRYKSRLHHRIRDPELCAFEVRIRNSGINSFVAWGPPRVPIWSVSVSSGRSTVPAW